ncbi:MAG: hypothetical protein PHQ98_04750 [Candidatus ainarchaeum sp.]|nr:hypothetical protein [Candidatus ainarchaeum sp.]
MERMALNYFRNLDEDSRLKLIRMFLDELNEKEKIEVAKHLIKKKK